MRRSSSVLGVWNVLREELQRIPAVMRFHAKEVADSTSRAYQFFTGANLNESEEMAAKRRKHREAYEEILRQQQRAGSASGRETEDNGTLAQRLKARAISFFTVVKNATSTNAGAMALLQHCAASHAAEVAVEENIDVKDVMFVFEKKKTGAHVGHEDVIVGYITAPDASEEEVMMYAEKLQKRCPVARAMGEKIEWRRMPSKKKKNFNGDDGGAGSQPSGAEPLLRGTPGIGRYTSPTLLDRENVWDSNEQQNLYNEKSKENSRDK